MNTGIIYINSKLKKAIRLTSLLLSFVFVSTLACPVPDASKTAAAPRAVCLAPVMNANILTRSLTPIPRVPVIIKVLDGFLAKQSERLYKHTARKNEFFQNNTVRLMKIGLVTAVTAVSFFITSIYGVFGIAMPLGIMAVYAIFAMIILYKKMQKKYGVTEAIDFFKKESNLILGLFAGIFVFPLIMSAVFPIAVFSAAMMELGLAFLLATILLYSLRLYQLVLGKLNTLLNSLTILLIRMSGPNSKYLESPKHIKWLSLENAASFIEFMGTKRFWEMADAHPEAMQAIVLNLTILSRAQKLGGMVREYPENTIPQILKAKLRAFGAMPAFNNQHSSVREMVILLFQALYPGSFDLTKIRNLAVDLGALETDGKNEAHLQIGPYPLREQIHNYPSKRDYADTITESKNINNDLSVLNTISPLLTQMQEIHHSLTADKTQIRTLTRRINESIKQLVYEKDYVKAIDLSSQSGWKKMADYTNARRKYLTGQEITRNELAYELGKMHNTEASEAMDALLAQYNNQTTVEFDVFIEPIMTILETKDKTDASASVMIERITQSNKIRKNIIARFNNETNYTNKEILMQLAFLVEGALLSGMYTKTEKLLTQMLADDINARELENLIREATKMLAGMLSVMVTMSTDSEEINQFQAQASALAATPTSFDSLIETMSFLKELNLMCESKRNGFENVVRKGLESIDAQVKNEMDVNSVIMGFYRDQEYPFVSATASILNKLTLKCIDTRADEISKNSKPSSKGMLNAPSVIEQTLDAAKKVTEILSFDDERYKYREVRGGKGAGLAIMRNWGLPVPPGITLPTGLHRKLMNMDEAEMMAIVSFITKQAQFRTHIKDIEKETGREFGATNSVPLLFSVRSGAPVSMPGQMETILNVGITHENVKHLALQLGNKGALNSYLTFVTGYATARQLATQEEIESQAKRLVALVSQVSEETSQEEIDAVINAIKKIQEDWLIPLSPEDQLSGATTGVLASWNSDNARQYRERYDIPDDMGTAVNIQAMVFGNSRQSRSATGVLYSINPNTGEPGPYGVYLESAQGTSVVSGESSAQDISAMKKTMPEAYKELMDWSEKLFDIYGEYPHEIEYTVENGKLWILQVRNAKLSVPAQMRFIMDKPNPRQALNRWPLKGKVSMLLGNPDLAKYEQDSLFAGTGVTPGITSGKLVTHPSEIIRGAGPYIFLVDATDVDIPEVEGLITMHGSTGSHASIVARERGIVVALDCGEQVKNIAAGQEITLASDGNRTIVLEGNMAKDVSTDTDNPTLQAFLQMLEEQLISERDVNNIFTSAA